MRGVCPSHGQAASVERLGHVGLMCAQTGHNVQMHDARHTQDKQHSRGMHCARACEVSI